MSVKGGIMKTRAVVTAVTVAAAVHLATSPASFGGDREWATAGKILAGAAFVQVAGQGLSIQSCAPPQQVIEQHYYVRRPCYYPPRRRVTYYRSCAPREVPYCAIITDAGPQRRVYHSRSHDHERPTFIQVWSGAEGRWVTIQEHPSRW
jgi:hypothetical protein